MTDEQRAKRLHHHMYETCEGIAEHAERIVRLEEENAKLRAERDYLLMNSNPTATELRRVRSAWKKDCDENAKLRELVRKYGEYTDQDRCEGCVLKRSCNDGEIDECWQIAEIREMEKELGVLGE